LSPITHFNQAFVAGDLETAASVGRYVYVTQHQPRPKAREILPWLALGPVTGLLAWRMYRSVRAGEPVLAALYAFLILSFWISLLGESGQALARLAQ